MEFEHISYGYGTGIRSKEVETYNFHKAAAVLAEYGFDCIRLADDWHGADFLAHHKGTGRTIRVQLKTCLVIDKRYKGDDDLYMCFPLDRTNNWYLIQHTRLVGTVREHEPTWLCKMGWDTEEPKGVYWRWRGSEKLLTALKPYAYQLSYGDLGFRECVDLNRANDRQLQALKSKLGKGLRV